MHCSFWSPFGFYNTCDTESPGPIRKQKGYKSCSSEELQSLPQPPAEGLKKLPVFLETKEMILPIVFLGLAAVLSPSTGQVPEAFTALITTNPDQQKLIVDKHNTLRRGVNPTASNMLRMEWNLAAATNAQNWANQCSLSHSPSSQRKTNVDCGENLYMSTAPSSWSDAIQAWYNEEKDFKYGVGATTKDAVIGHYTQVVWYKSYQIGCAVAYCPNSNYKYFYVCQYCPAGNRVDLMKTPYKEGKPCGDCPNACDNGLCTNPCKFQDLYSNCPGLVNDYGCANTFVMQNCPASCQCKTEIK
ncbi:cysteine-rich venom protein-like isoform X2 [Anser cygnoides]|uniref:cysteine-rich venom protein-like isoform X2 n=1 Tax=Anser cygnoides TaxID=8845 RepID=UPI0034D1D8DF